MYKFKLLNVIRKTIFITHQVVCYMEKLMSCGTAYGWNKWTCISLSFIEKSEEIC